jgi:hypothetical protein
VNLFRSLSLRPPLALGLALTTVGIGLALPILDSDWADLGTQAVSDTSGPASPLSHDHRLCILYRSSPGLATSDATPAVDPFVACSDASQVSVAWIPREQAEKPTARAPPYPS